MKELTILMCWHDDPDPEKQQAYAINKNSFIHHNPESAIISIPNRFENKDKAWLSTDLNIFLWFVDEGYKIESERYLLVEWDCWCNCNLKDYYSRVWDCDVVGPSVFYPKRDYWNWFNAIPDLPLKARPYATGIVPFNGILLSGKAMESISKEILKAEFDNFNSEMRLATIASMLNMDPIVNPVCNRNITWKEVDYFDYSQQSLFHPVKKPVVF
ncbi:hypothetical protein [Pedobacter metabolipauper]|uniref:DUF5672 domain-containing protein n=1 Tax=Pedobacter metabolipauper TaxID=425513 RepID=A0A4R6SU28_9SPHI|nr:hypothetical protein [Pedobacter metabolipauper]TDQ08443.1 hypothetical protein ATK78_2957 [Pedobacter metabolipauper]